MVTIKSIAESLSLSSSTVSRALRNDETLSISPETKTKIFMAAEKLGYVAKEKKTLPKIDEKKVTVVHKQQTFRNQIDSSYYFSVRTGIEDACSKEQFTCSFTTLESLDTYQASTDGVIIVGNYTKDQFDLILTKFKNTPIATIGIISYYPDKIDHITHSNYESVHMALTYLFENGHTKVGYLGIEEAPGTELFGSRKQHFIDIMNEKGLFNASWVYESEHGQDRVERGYITMQEWISCGTPFPTAIFCANDPIALGAIKALHEAQLYIPEKISIVAHDGSYPTQYSLPPLTTVDVHPYQLGLESIAVLLERISGKRKIAKKILFYPELIIRDSVRSLM